MTHGFRPQLALSQGGRTAAAGFREGIRRGDVWAQFFLKFLLSHPAITAVIPGTDKPEYMRDNLQAGRGPLPDAAMRRRMIQYWDSLT